MSSARTAGRKSSPEPAPRGRKRLTAEDRREAILSAAREVFRSNGLRGASTREIAAAANVNEALLYRHFDNKDALFLEAVVEPIEELRTQVDEIVAMVPKDAEPKVDWEITKLVFEHLLEVVEDVLPSLALVLFDPELSERFYRDHFEPTLAHIERTIIASIARRPHRRFDSAVTTRALVGACIMYAVDAKLGTRPISRKQAARELARLFVTGVVETDELADGID